MGLIHETASLISTEIVTHKDKKVSKKVKTKQKPSRKVKTKQKQSKKGQQTDPPNGKEKETLEEKRSDKESNIELILESQVDEWYLHDCLE